MSCYVYVSLAGENKISIFTMDPETGKLQLKEDVSLSSGPGPLAVDPEQNFIYAGLRSTREIASFRIDRATAGLSLIKTISVEADSCYLSTDRRGRFLLSSSYGGGVAWVHSIGPDGAAQAPPVDWHITAPKAHSIQTDSSNRFAFVPHVGESNAIFQFEFDEETGRLTPNVVPRAVPEEQIGPRHYDFHPTRDILYADNEQGSSVTAYHFDPAAGTLEAFQTISTTPEDFEEYNDCAQIHIAPSGKFLYVSNRGHDSIASFAIDDETGRLTSTGQQPTEETPRAFNVDPAGRFLFAAGLGTGRLASYRIDPDSGTLTPLETYDVGQNPMWVLPLDLGN